VQLHQCGLTPNVEEQQCGSGGSYGEWQSWGQCTQSCTGGTDKGNSSLKDIVWT